MENGDNMGQGMAPNQAIVNNSVVAEPEPVQEKKKVNVPAILFGITTLIFAGLAVYFGMEYFKPKSGQNGDAGNQGGNDAVVVETADMVDDYREVGDLVKQMISGVGISGTGYIKTSSGVDYKIDGMNAYVPTRFSIEAEVRSNNIAADGSELGERLKNAGFVLVGEMPSLGSAGPRPDGYLNSDKKIACEVYGNVSYSQYGTDPTYYLNLNCAKTSWGWLTDDEEKLMGELEVAYYDKTGEYPSIMGIAFNDELEDSEYEPYQKMMITVSGAKGLFYRTSPESEWKYFTAVQAPLSCDIYDTEDLRKAFAGDVCYDGQTESTVQP